MKLIQSNLYVFVELEIGNGRWVIANAVINTDGAFKVQIQNEDAYTIQLSDTCVITAPQDTVFNIIPPLPFRRSAKETFSIHIKKNSTIWFLASCEEERDGWCKALNGFTNRKPLPYGDYDNWNYNQDIEIETKILKSCHSLKSLASQHRTGFYFIQESKSNCSKLPDASHAELDLGFYSPAETKRSLKFPDSVAPQHRSGFYSIHKPKKKASDEINISPVDPLESGVEKSESKNIRCRCCCVSLRCLVNIFGSCLHHCCTNFASAV
ncbi:uncharacterized protein CDAR_273101 [Caerostris darwini]|uniref:PH domain-containing protein n=1 Tax=Caerostris darwini TaxID=1538125 RepID=A0AAV4MHX0_9ARAC|nr:uncharacterized protein CDAR_273101 [Caerostris darwini]